MSVRKRAVFFFTGVMNTWLFSRFRSVLCLLRRDCKERDVVGDLYRHHLVIRAGWNAFSTPCKILAVRVSLLSS